MMLPLTAVTSLINKAHFHWKVPFISQALRSLRDLGFAFPQHGQRPRIKKNDTHSICVQDVLLNARCCPDSSCTFRKSFALTRDFLKKTRGTMQNKLLLAVKIDLFKRNKTSCFNIHRRHNSTFISGSNNSSSSSYSA